MPANPATVAANDFLRENGWKVIADFISLLQMPNVTGSVDDLARNAAEISRRLDARGVDTEVIQIDGVSPVVIGELRTERPTATLGVYVHYDGQPVDPDAWSVPPFSATILSSPLHAGGEVIAPPGPGDTFEDDWRIYARSASDDKTPISAILAALDVVSTSGLERSVDLVFLFEGEEESGSPNLERYMRDLAPRLKADAWLLCDGPIHQSRRPQVAFGARGYSGFDLTFYGPERELHSGHYGNWVPNPAMELARFLAACKDDEGRVTIPGFYETSAPVTDADRSAMGALPDIAATLQDEHGFAGPEVSEATYAERLMVPSFNVRGLRSADVGAAARNVVPAEATASIDMRLVAGNDPAAMVALVEAHLRAQGYEVIDREPTPRERRAHRRLARLDPTVGYRAARIPMDSPLAVSLLEVCAAASGEEAVALPTFGGSVPLYLFEDVLGASVAILPIANHDNNQHAPDENIRLGNLRYGISLWTTILTWDFASVRTDNSHARLS